MVGVDLPVLLTELGRIGSGQDGIQKTTKKPRRGGASIQ